MEKVSNKTLKTNNILIIVILLLWTIASTVFFVYTTQDNAVKDFEDTLEIVAVSNAEAVCNAFDKYINIMQISADFFRNANFETEYFEQAFNDLVEIDDFSNIAVVLPEGVSYVTNSETLVVAEYEFTEKMQEGEIFISDVYYDVHLKTNSVSVNVPLYNDENEFVAYIIGILKTETLSENFNEQLYDVAGYYQVIDINGSYVALSDSEIMFAGDDIFSEIINSLDFLDGYSADDLLNSFITRESGLTRYKEDDEIRTAYYAPVAVNDWIILSAIPQDIISKEINESVSGTIILITNIAIMFLFLLIWVYNSQRALKKYAQQSEKNLRFVSEKTKKYIIEFDFLRQEIKISGRLPKVFGTEDSTNVVPMADLFELISDEDKAMVAESLDKLREGTQISDFKLRIRRNNGKIVWCMFSGALVESGEYVHQAHKAIGFIENIDEQEKESALLKEMSQMDLLTKIYNKGTTETLIENIIVNSVPSEDKHSLVIIDLDNFKSLNDTFGHQFGDEVIKEMANFLKKLFRHNDIVGRIGGDEFFVFMKDTFSEQLVTDKCQTICDYFNKSYEKNGKSVRISSSIGVAFYPKHGDVFEDLYKNSDIALYHAKKLGKNNVQFYNGSTDIDYVSNRTDIESQGADIEE